MSLDIYLIDPVDGEALYSANITHNLTKMADKAGIYQAMWRPEEIKSAFPKLDIIAIIERGLMDLKKRPEYYKPFNSLNGWGLYKHFVPFVEEYLKALKEYPDAKIKARR